MDRMEMMGTEEKEAMVQNGVLQVLIAGSKKK